LTGELGQTVLVYGVRSGFISGPCAQDYKSLCAAVMICSPMFNVQTHTHHLTSLFEQAQPAELKELLNVVCCLWATHHSYTALNISVKCLAQQRPQTRTYDTRHAKSQSMLASVK